jgi:hypothetical protein
MTGRRVVEKLDRGHRVPMELQLGCESYREANWP